MNNKETTKKVKPEPRFTKEQEADMFKQLSHKTLKVVGREFGIEGSDKNVSSTMSNIAKKIRKAPELWGISKDTMEVVQSAIDSRSISKNPKMKSDIALYEESFRDKLDRVRDTAAEILSKKLKRYNTAKGLKEISIRDVKDVLAMAIDKSRLLKGESTENIKKLSPIDVEGMTKEDAIKVVLKAREILIEGKK